ncbi:MAG: class I SAM-dependent methyltransferase [Alkalibacterium sp.]|nr:class I SAM-dependent methyltransferase [Alkalibacterium sp.]
MSSSEEKLAQSLTAESVELVPFLPYLLQDLWELGSSPDDMVELITNHKVLTSDSTVLDLACGKGAVSIKIAEQFQCRAKGYDLMSDFIKEARNKAADYHVSDLCTFLRADITLLNLEQEQVDLVVFGAVGNVLGEPPQMLNRLKEALKPAGYILLDDGYALTETYDYYTRKDWLKFFEQTNLMLLDEITIEKDHLISLCDEQISYITTRSEELKLRHPYKADLFDSYVRSQKAECEELENDIIGVTFLLKMN